MTEPFVSHEAAFDSTVLDESTELLALKRSIEFASGFQLLFAVCNQPRRRRELIEQLRSSLPETRIQQIDLTDPIEHLLDHLRQSLDPDADAVFVDGLERSLPSAESRDPSGLIANLNVSRNSFPLVLSCPLVLWVPEYAFAKIVRGAPDFTSVRSGTYFFATPPSTDDVQRLTDGDFSTIENLPKSEKQERLETIQSLLADLDALPDAVVEFLRNSKLLWVAVSKSCKKPHRSDDECNSAKNS